MRNFKIVASAHGPTLYYHVYQRVLPLPVIGWELEPSYTTVSRLDAEEWIEHTQFAGSREGQRLAYQRELDARKNRRIILEKREEARRRGWIWDARTMTYTHVDTGEVRMGEAL